MKNFYCLCPLSEYYLASTSTSSHFIRCFEVLCYFR